MLTASGIEATTAVTVVGLIPNVTYDMFVQTNCGGDLSTFTGSVTFITLGLPP